MFEDEVRLDGLVDSDFEPAEEDLAPRGALEGRDSGVFPVTDKPAGEGLVRVGGRIDVPGGAMFSESRFMMANEG